MICTDISCGDGMTSEEWVALEEGETVLCWWVPQCAYGSYKYGAYAIVDEYGWPIVVPEPQPAIMPKYGT